MVKRTLLLIVVFLSPLTLVEAASLKLDIPEEAAKADVFAVTMRLETVAAQCINVVDAVLQYPPEVEVVDISTGSSILRLWPEAPTVNAEAGTISFAGGIPNGYCGPVEGDPGVTNALLDIYFQIPPGSDMTEFPLSFARAVGYPNDGRGEPRPLETRSYVFPVEAMREGVLKNEWIDRVQADTESPAPFSLALDRDESGAYNGKYYVAFNTTDKQSGIDRYEVIEEPLNNLDLFRWGAANAPWQEVVSPYVLEDQSLNSIIRVKAIDKAGNFIISTLVPDESLRTVSYTQIASYVAYISVLLVFVAAISFGILYWRRRSDIPQMEHTETLDPDSKRYTTNNEIDERLYEPGQTDTSEYENR